MKQPYLLVFLSFVFSIPCFGQEFGVEISGEVMSDSIPVENVHIINTRAYNNLNRNLILHTEAKLTSALVLECGCVKMCSVKEKHHVTSRTTADNINTTLS